MGPSLNVLTVELRLEIVGVRKEASSSSSPNLHAPTRSFVEWASFYVEFKPLEVKADASFFFFLVFFFTELGPKKKGVRVTEFYWYTDILYWGYTCRFLLIPNAPTKKSYPEKLVSIS